MTYKGFEISDDRIDKAVDTYGCSIAEACDMILEDEGKIAPSAETVAEIAVIEKKAKDMKRHYEKSDKPRKPSTKERKVDTEKGFLLAEVKALVETLGAVETVVKTETELSFDFNGNHYTFKLTKHRPPKTQADKPPEGLKKIKKMLDKLEKI